MEQISGVKNGLDRVTVVTSIPIPKYSDIQKRPIIFNNCTRIYDDMGQEQGATPNMRLTKSVIGF